MIKIEREPDIIYKGYKYFFKEQLKYSIVKELFIPIRFDIEGGMIDTWHNDQNSWIWDDEATIAFQRWFGKELTNVQQLQKRKLCEHN